MCCCTSLVFFSRYVVQKMIASKTVSAICAGDIKEMVERLTDLMKQTLVPVNQAIEQYYSMELRFPLSVFSGIVGKNRLESLLYLLSDESLHKYRNNPFYRKICKQDTLLLSYECVVMASYMEALKDIRSRYRVVCTEQVKAQLISDIDELLRNIRDEKQRGSLSLNEGSLSYMQITNEIRRERHAFLARLKSDIISIEAVKESDWNIEEPELVQQLSQRKAYCECSCLGTAQVEKYMLVTDDEFLYAAAESCGYPNMGICSLLVQCDFPSTKMIEVSRKMSKLNLVTYINPMI